MQEKTCICIIVPVYNVEEYLHRCIDSILGQTFSDFFLILVDDGSTDSSGRICDEYKERDTRVKVFHKNNGGQGEARNLALDWAYEHISFEWVAFIDSDDWVHYQYLEILYDAAVNNKVLLSSCGYIRSAKDSVDLEITGLSKGLVDSADNLIAFFEHNEFNLGVPWGRLYHKSLFVDLRYPTDRYYEDGFTVYKALFCVDRIAVVQEKLYYWFVNSNSTTLSNISEKKINDYIDAMLEPIAYYKEHSFDKAYKHEVSTFLYRLGVHLESYKNDQSLQRVNKRFRKEARRLIRCDRKTFPFSQYDDGYKMVFNRYEYLFYKIINRFGL